MRGSKARRSFTTYPDRRICPRRIGRNLYPASRRALSDGKARNLMAKCDVAIIGAGPYGLSAAAHLKTLKGLEVRVFGEPMSFWERHMPAGMRLKSVWRASHISDPSGG